MAQAPDVLEVRKILKRETINGQPFHPGDYVIRIGRYFDRDPADTSSLTFEEWLPELVFSKEDVGSKLTISVFSERQHQGGQGGPRRGLLGRRAAGGSLCGHHHCGR